MVALQSRHNMLIEPLRNTVKRDRAFMFDFDELLMFSKGDKNGSVKDDILTTIIGCQIITIMRIFLSLIKYFIYFH